MRKLAIVAALVLSACASKAPDSASPTSITLTPADRAAIDEAVRQAGSRPLKQPVAWANAANNTAGRVTTLREGYTEAGTRCREYHVLVVQGALQAHEVGFACQGPGGEWRPIGS